MAMAGSLSAQTFRGTILGTVTDPNGAVVPIASVSARNIATGIERTTTSDEFGNYSIAELQTGTYEVKVEKSGFQSSTVTGVLVEVSAERRVDVTLTVAGSQATVTIASSAQVETTSNTLGGTITSRAVADLAGQWPRLHQVSGHGSRRDRRSIGRYRLARIVRLV